MLFSTLARILRLASIVICLIALASFVTFAVDQTGKGSNHQQAEVNEAAPAGTATTNTNASGESSTRVVCTKRSTKPSPRSPPPSRA